MKSKYALFTHTQRTVKRQLGMFFRNRRRISEPPTSKSNGVGRSKLQLVNIVAAKHAENHNGQEIVTDIVTFERYHSRLLEEFQRTAKQREHESTNKGNS